MQELQVGLIGFGMASQVFHAPVISAVPHLRLAKIVERHSDLARQQYPAVALVRDVAALLDDQAIELVVIATPNTTHFTLAQQALLANKHVVIDKPFTTTAAEAQHLIDLAAQRQRILSVHHNRRWDGDFLTVQAIIERGWLGSLVEYESHFDRYRSNVKPAAWREEATPGSGIVFDLGSHLIDQAHVLFGLPRAVTADIRIQREGAKVDDQFELILDYGSIKVTLKAGMLVREPGPRFALHGSAGSFVKYGLDPQEAALKRGELPSDQWGLEPPDEWGTLNTQLNGLHVYGKVETLPGRYQTYYENIYQAIRQQAALLVTPEAARDTIRVIEAALQSNAEKRTIVFADIGSA